MKHVQACLNARDDRESSFHHCGRPVRWFKPVYARKRPENAFFNLREGTVKHVKAGLTAREDRECSFHRCRGPVRLVHACLCAGRN